MIFNINGLKSLEKKCTLTNYMRKQDRFCFCFLSVLTRELSNILYSIYAIATSSGYTPKPSGKTMLLKVPYGLVSFGFVWVLEYREISLGLSWNLTMSHLVVPKQTIVDTGMKCLQ